MSAESQGSQAREARLPAFESAGLVPSKTSRQTCSVNLSAPECALRRIKRLKRSVWASGHLHGMAFHGRRPPQCWFVTLTYVGVKDWRPHHVSKAIERFRSWCSFNGYPCRYTWVAELQNRGAVHYHLLAWLPHGVRMPHWDRPQGRRAAFWPHGMTNTEKALSGVGYLMKYLSKLGELTKFPKGLRLYGIGGLCKDGRSVRRWYNLPEWAKRSFGVGELIRRKVGLVVHATGELLAPAYKVLPRPWLPRHPTGEGSARQVGARGLQRVSEGHRMTTIVCDSACTVTLAMSLPPFDLSTEDAALISAAVIAVWALAWGFRMLVRTVRTTDTPETD